jgi:hypothetical protein
MTLSILGITILTINLAYAFTVKTIHEDYYSYSLLAMVGLGLPLLLLFKNQMDKLFNKANINADE